MTGPVERMKDAQVRAAERRNACREIVRKLQARGWVFEDQEGGPEADVAAVLDEVAPGFAEAMPV